MKKMKITFWIIGIFLPAGVLISGIVLALNGTREHAIAGSFMVAGAVLMPMVYALIADPRNKNIHPPHKS